ncbi:MAG: hypothetical protein V8S24_14815 [Gordonibacter pamelaeae]
MEPKRELTDERRSSCRSASGLERREMASVIHYDGEAYVRRGAS